MADEERSDGEETPGEAGTDDGTEVDDGAGTGNEAAHGHNGADREYDPTNVELPSREPPLRSTAPQSDFTMGQVSTGFIVLVIGLVVTVGLALVIV